MFRYWIKACLLTLFISLFVGVTAFASVSIEKINYTNNIIEVNGNLTDSTGGTVTMIVYKKNGSVQNDSDIVAIKEIVLTKSETFKLRFKMIDDRTDINGVYTVRLKLQNDKIAQADFPYRSEASRIELNNRMKASGTVEILKSYLDDEANLTTLTVSGLDMDVYNNLNDGLKTKVNTMIFENRELSTFNYIDFATAFNQATYFIGYNSSDNLNSSVLYLEKLNLKYNYIVSYSDIISGSDSQLLSVLQDAMYASKPYISDIEMTTRFNEVYALYSIANARIIDIESTIVSNSILIGYANDARYIKYVAINDKSDINDKIKNALYNKNIYKTEDFLNVLKNASIVTTTTTSDSSKGNTGGTGKYISNDIIAQKEQENTAVFSDLNDSLWAQESIMYLFNKGIVNGYGDNRFRPLSSITREEFIKLIICATELYVDGADSQFSDVKKEDWFYKYIAGAAKQGIVNGITTDIFGIGQNITREDMVVIAYRAAKLKGIEFSALGEKPLFNDINDISDYAMDIVTKLRSAGIVNGTDKGAFNPKNSCTRAEATKVIYEMFFNEK